MKKLYGIMDDDGRIYAAYKTNELVSNLDPVLLVENPTWETSDWSEDGTNYIICDRLADLFNDLCRSTGIKKKDLAKICGKSAVQFSKYCNGTSPVPKLVWDRVKEFEIKDLKK